MSLVKVDFDIVNPDYDSVFEVIKFLVGKKGVLKETLILGENLTKQKKDEELVGVILFLVKNKQIRKCIIGKINHELVKIAHGECEVKVTYIKIWKSCEDVISVTLFINGASYPELIKIGVLQLSERMPSEYIFSIGVPMFDCLHHTLEKYNMGEQFIVDVIKECNHGLCALLSDVICKIVSKKNDKNIIFEIENMKCEFLSKMED